MSQASLFPDAIRGDYGQALILAATSAVRLKRLEPSKKADQARVKGEVEVGEMSTTEQGSRIRAKAALKSFVSANEKLAISMCLRSALFPAAKKSAV